MEWDQLIDEAAITALLPGEHARFARPVRAALVHFLSGLSPHEQREVLVVQALLGPEASMAERLGRLARCCPVLHKLGQTLARDDRLAAELREELRPLESLPPATPMEAIERALAAELGDHIPHAVRLRPPAIAEASVAVVVPFEYGDRFERQGVLKVLKPGIEERLSGELRLVQGVGELLDARCSELGIPRLDYRETFDQVSAKLSCEVHLHEEQRNLALARRLYADEPRVQIPALLPYCTPRVSAMERVFGAKVSDHRAAGVREQNELARLVFRALIVRPLLACGETAIFHCDPHPGNLLLTDDGRLAILDWSLVGRLHEGERAAIVQICLAAMTLNGARIETLLRELGPGSAVDSPRLHQAVNDAVRQIAGGRRLPGLTWLTDLLDSAVQRCGLRLPAELVLFRKMLLTLEGALRELHAEFDRDLMLLQELFTQFLWEAPARWFARFGSRNFPTRVANTDLLELLLNTPAAAARYWLSALPGEAAAACSAR